MKNKIMRLITPHAKHKPITGFSLVELAIVLVVLGLLVGFVLAGRSMIRASELRAITTERNRYAAAVFTFRDKYLQLPGDMNNAFQFWGTTCGTDTTLVNTGCNGDGDGVVKRLAVAEDKKAWEHLARAGIIEGSYDGTGINALPMVPSMTYVYPSPTNSPASKFPKFYWDLSSSSLGLVLSVGAIDNPSWGSPIGYGSSMTRIEAWNIDTKTDDGAASTGKVRGAWPLSGCMDIGTDYYSVSLGPDKDGCSLGFVLQ